MSIASQVSKRLFQAGKATLNTADRMVGKTVDVAAGIGRSQNPLRGGERSFTNGYTGFRETGLVKAGVAVAAAGYVGYKGFMATNENPFGSTRIGEVSYAGAAPEMNYDGVSNATKAPNLGASGDLVFGLHNMRKG